MTLAFPLPEGVCPPVLHCLRHSFAVGCLLRWYREGVDPQARLYRLSTFMGHVSPISTAVYLTITPQLLAEASRRFEAFAAPVWSEEKPMSESRPLGPLVHSFFVDHLVAVKGLRPATVRSYRDTVRLLLCFVAENKKAKITRLGVEDLSFERVLGFLRYLEEARGNHVRTRNQRLAALHTLFDYIASREPEMLGTCQQVAAIPMKRAAPAGTHFLERDEIEALFRGLPRTGRLALRDRALLLFLYNTGARVQEVADLRVEHLELGEAALVRLHGKGDKWRTCPLWRQTAALLTELLDTSNAPKGPERPGVPIRDRGRPHSLRHLQDRPPPHRAPR